MNVLLTFGPGHEPIDPSQRLTTSSTGELGTHIAETLAEAGHIVTCFRGTTSSYPAPLFPVRVAPFTTGTDLVDRLHLMPDRQNFQIVIHAAALYPYSVTRESTSDGAVQLTLVPTNPLIFELRSLFPNSIIVGWKYQLDGELQSILSAGRDQLDQSLTDSCILMGPAYGKGYGVLSRSGERAHLPDKRSLCTFLKEFLERLPNMSGRAGPESFHALAALFPLAPFI